jgi:hypothetical protein
MSIEKINFVKEDRKRIADDTEAPYQSEELRKPEEKNQEIIHQEIYKSIRKICLENDDLTQERTIIDICQNLVDGKIHHIKIFY